MGDNLNPSSLLDNASIKNSMSLSVDNSFRLPYPLPSWPSGGCFASGVIDLGGLHVSQVSSLTKVWSTYEGGRDNLGTTFFEPSNLPNGFFMFDSYSEPNNMPLFWMDSCWERYIRRILSLISNLVLSERSLLYTNGQESSPVGIHPTGSNLPQGGSNDGAYWLDLPIDDVAKTNVKKGAKAYLHVKPMFGATYTDIAVWLFYSFNGPAKAKLEIMTIYLGKIGEHVGDREHVTLRINNFNGELQGVYFSQHSGGIWVSACQLEFQNGNQPVVYSSLHGDAAYPKPGKNFQGRGDARIRNYTGKGKLMDTGANFSIVAVEYLGSTIVEPPWLNYAREWGPKIIYDISKELKKVERFMIGKLKEAIEKIVRDLPYEVLGEGGPIGPQIKDTWSGDESG
ncbi:unnamed protein product [Withania somnifera]